MFYFGSSFRLLIIQFISINCDILRLKAQNSVLVNLLIFNIFLLHQITTKSIGLLIIFKLLPK